MTSLVLAATLVLSTLIPGSTGATIYHKSLNPAVGAGVRWTSNVTIAPDSSVWWRWQFSSRPQENFYDVMFWAGDATLRYQTTNRDCDSDGNGCGDVTAFSPPIGFGPKTWSGETKTVTGLSTVSRANCTGQVAWSWTVQPTVAADIQTTAIRTDFPLAHVTVNEAFSGPCGAFSWVEDWWWGTACQQNVCVQGPVQTKGGTKPWVADASHWFMTFDRLALP